MEAKDVKVGFPVTFVDPHGTEHDALVTAVWSPWGDSQHGGPMPSINLVFVSCDENRTDSCGRQIERATSVPHHVNQAANGNYWK